MTLMRRALIPVLATAALVAGGLAWTTSSASSATAPTYSLTVSGTDTHSLDPHLQTMFEPGGGVIGLFPPGVSSQTDIKNRYFEVGLDLPVGAKVNYLSVTAGGCGWQPHAYFGSYQPTTRNTAQAVALNLPGSTCAPKTFVKSGALATVAAGRRYVIDYQPAEIGAYPGNPTVSDAFYGATIKYTCTSPCTP